jgi:hypothetical protein
VDPVVTVLIGAAAGGLISTAQTLTLQSRTDRKDSRAARRLVQAELLAIRVSLVHGKDHGSWDLVMEKLSDHTKWEANQRQLARDIAHDAVWEKVERAYRATFAAMRVAELPPGHASKDERVYDEALSAIDEALAALDKRWWNR